MKKRGSFWIPQKESLFNRLCYSVGTPQKFVFFSGFSLENPCHVLQEKNKWLWEKENSNTLQHFFTWSCSCCWLQRFHWASWTCACLIPRGLGLALRAVQPHAVALSIPDCALLRDRLIDRQSLLPVGGLYGNYRQSLWHRPILPHLVSTL